MLHAKLEQQEDYQVAAEQLRAAISDHLSIDNLTSLILNKLIERMEVGSVNVVDSHKQQELTIVWRFAGRV